MKTSYWLLRSVRIGVVAACCAGSPCLAASGLPDDGKAAPRDHGSALGFARLARALARARAVPLPGEIPLSAVIAVKVTVTRQDAETAEEADTDVILWRQGGRFEATGTDVPPPLVAAVTRLPADAVPVTGLQPCTRVEDEPVEAAPPYLSVDLMILAHGRRPVRVRSESRCGNLLPWHVTDGRELAALTRPAAGEALLALVRAACPSCLPPLPHQPYEARAAAPGNSDFATHYATLLRRWRRLGRKHGPTEVLIETQPLTDALDWMDRPRFERLLEAAARDSRGSAGALARKTLQILQVARWGYMDRQGKWLLPRRFERAGVFAAGSALVKEDGLWRAIDRRGREVRQVRTGEPSYVPIALQPSERDGKWGFADASGALVIPPSFGAVEPFQEGLAAARRNGRWGFVDEKGAWALEPQFEAVRSFSEGLAAVKREGLWGYVDRSGRTVIPPRFLEAADFGQGLAPVR